MFYIRTHDSISLFSLSLLFLYQNRNAACNDAIEMLSIEEEKGSERGRERGSVPTWTSDALIRDTLLVRTYVHARKIPRDCHFRF